MNKICLNQQVETTKQSTYVCFVDAKKHLTLYKETVYGTN